MSETDTSFDFGANVEVVMEKQLFHAHVQHPRGSGYMMRTGSFRDAEEAVAAYLELVDADENPFGRRALENYADGLRVTLIPAELRGPDVMGYLGFCNVWNEDGTDAFKMDEPDYVIVPNPRFSDK
jgi:hypothetical protein